IRSNQSPAVVTPRDFFMDADYPDAPLNGSRSYQAWAPGNDPGGRRPFSGVGEERHLSTTGPDVATAGGSYFFYTYEGVRITVADDPHYSRDVPARHHDVKHHDIVLAPLPQ